MSNARDNILQRLRENRPHAVPAPPVYEKPLGWDLEKKIVSFSERMRAVRGEVHRLGRTEWVDWIGNALASQGLTRGLLGTSETADTFAASARDDLRIRRYEQSIEGWKDELFQDIDFSLTGSLSGLAESGSLVLWPDAKEPRLMSLVPPVHIVVLDASRLFENFAAMIRAEQWAERMPTNALLISGPSKTADIEQTLAYGIHGPKRLITLIVE